MAWSKVMLLAGLIGALLIDLAPSATAAERSRDACRRGDRLHIQDLDMTPDPLIQGQLIRAWRVQIRLEGNRACDTEIEIREGGEAVGRVRRTTLRPGVNQIAIEPNERYRFRAGEHCFRVVADLEGTRKEVDAARRFCAYQRPAWSMRESGDARRGNR